MTKDGMLEKFGVNPSDNLEEKCASAAIVTNKLSAEGYEPKDHHSTLNGDKFLQWMKNRLIPAFKKKYPRNKMVQREVPPLPRRGLGLAEQDEEDGAGCVLAAGGDEVDQYG
jgi:hypothetical protein